MEDLPVGAEIVLKVVETEKEQCNGCFFPVSTTFNVTSAPTGKSSISYCFLRFNSSKSCFKRL